MDASDGRGASGQFGPPPSRPPWLTVEQLWQDYAAATEPLPVEPSLMKLTVTEDRVPNGHKLACTAQPNTPRAWLSCTPTAAGW